MSTPNPRASSKLAITEDTHSLTDVEKMVLTKSKKKSTIRNRTGAGIADKTVCSLVGDTETG